MATTSKDISCAGHIELNDGCSGTLSTSQTQIHTMRRETVNLIMLVLHMTMLRL